MFGNLLYEIGVLIYDNILEFYCIQQATKLPHSINLYQCHSETRKWFKEKLIISTGANLML